MRAEATETQLFPEIGFKNPLVFTGRDPVRYKGTVLLPESHHPEIILLHKDVVVPVLPVVGPAVQVPTTGAAIAVEEVAADVDKTRDRL